MWLICNYPDTSDAVVITCLAEIIVPPPKSAFPEPYSGSFITSTMHEYNAPVLMSSPFATRELITDLACK